MKEKSRLTPINRRRERLVEWANDTQWGERLARWIGKAVGGLQLRWMISAPGAPAWAPLRRPIAGATVALVTTGGVHLCADTPFNLSTDASFRTIPRTAQAADLCLTHEHYDRRDAARDLNLVFPLERLRELETAGIIGRVADVHYGFGFTKNPAELVTPAREVGRRLAQAQVDLALLVPA